MVFMVRILYYNFHTVQLMHCALGVIDYAVREKDSNKKHVTKALIQKHLHAQLRAYISTVYTLLINA